MAGSNAVWGIDIGQCSLKAIRCRQGDKPGKLVAEAFDFIAYPKILSQPGADPAELIAEALKLFLSRNSVQGDRVAIAVPGQNGLARFIKLPPVEAKKIPDIVRYEAKQQIPFDLADVIWDYQRMGGGAEEEGFALETEVGLFAMKRDQVYRALEPFTDAGIEVDVIQLTPLALYNFLLFDQMQELPPADQYDPDNPPPSTLVLSLGTDATDLVVTNGYRVWQRSIPLGGNHFTKALTKEMKLTFAKAEHLKCNAASAPDPRALFQAMRPVFNDLLTEIQRSIGYFTSIDRRATIEKMVVLGNAMKMPGLRRYLSQSLSVEVVRVEAFDHLTGPEVVGAPAFKENVLSFGVAYGLAVQGLEVGRGTLLTNLLPPEIVKDRFIRAKKPWVLAAVAMLLLGCAISYGTHSFALAKVAPKRYSSAESRMQNVISRSQNNESQAEEAKLAFENAHKTGQHLIGNKGDRIRWLELLRAVNEALPQGEALDKRSKNPDEWKSLYIDKFECQHVDDLATWYTNNPDKYPKQGNAATSADGATATPAAATPTPTPGMNPTPNAMPPASGTQGTDNGSGPSGEGWVIQLSGHHLHNPTDTGGGVYGAQYVLNTLIAKLETNDILLPSLKKESLVDAAQEQKKDLVSMKELGIGYPRIVYDEKIVTEFIDDPFADMGDESAAGVPGAAGGPVVGGIRPGRPAIGASKQAKQIPVRKYKFVVEFTWQPTTPSERQEKRKEKQQQPSDQTE